MHIGLLIIALKLTDKSAETFVLILKDVLFYVDKLYYTISIILCNYYTIQLL